MLWGPGNDPSPVEIDLTVLPVGKIRHRLAMYGSILVLPLVLTVPASADLRITRDNGGYLEEYKAKYARIQRAAPFSVASMIPST
jgi:hypothetical protein